MDSVKRLSLKVVSAGLTFTGAIAVLSAFGSAAYAVPGVAVPEIDPGSIVSAMTLLFGSTMLLSGRRLSK